MPPSDQASHTFLGVQKALQLACMVPGPTPFLGSKKLCSWQAWFQGPACSGVSGWASSVISSWLCWNVDSSLQEGSGSPASGALLVAGSRHRAGGRWPASWSPTGCARTLHSGSQETMVREEGRGCDLAHPCLVGTHEGCDQGRRTELWPRTPRPFWDK